MKESIISKLRESAALKLRFAKESVEQIGEATQIVQKSLGSGGKILIFGNGVSSAEAKHIATEFASCYLEGRVALAAVALSSDDTAIASVGDADTVEDIFSRQIKAIGKKGDVAWGISTKSKTSQQIIKALEFAKSQGLKTVGFTGEKAGEMEGIVDSVITVPSDSIHRIQEIHITIAHIICELVEAYLKETKNNKKPSGRSQKNK